MNGFTKTRRLLTKADYDYVFAHAKKLVTAEFTILYHTNSLGYARLGLIFPKKIIPKAHDRNRLKRLLRETFRVTQLPTVDIVVLARREISTLENKAIITKIGTIWDKLKALYAK